MNYVLFPGAAKQFTPDYCNYDDRPEHARIPIKNTGNNVSDEMKHNRDEI